MQVNRIIYVLAAAVLFMSGYWLRAYLHHCPVAEPQVTTEYVDRVRTEIVYVPKADGEKTDVDVAINKPELNVKVNGKDFKISKSDDEEYIFDKNKLSLTQTSRSDLNISIPTIDKTRKWGIGVGASKSGAAGLARFPIKGNIGGWAAGSRDGVMGGIEIRF